MANTDSGYFEENAPEWPAQFANGDVVQLVSTDGHSVSCRVVALCMNDRRITLELQSDEDRRGDSLRDLVGKTLGDDSLLAKLMQPRVSADLAMAKLMSPPRTEHELRGTAVFRRTRKEGEEEPS